MEFYKEWDTQLFLERREYHLASSSTLQFTSPNVGHVCTMMVSYQFTHSFRGLCHVLYSTLHLRHPCRQSALLTVKNFPCQQYTKHISIWPENVADLTYTKDEALDLSIFNLSADWGAELDVLLSGIIRLDIMQTPFPFIFHCHFVQ